MLLDLRSFADNSTPRVVSVNDASALTDNLLLDLLLQPILFDSTTVTELVQLPFYIILSDATTATDASTTLLPILLVNINQESTLVMTDVPTLNWFITMALNDATAVTDVQTVLLPVLVPSVNDATGITEFTLVYWPLTLTESDTTGISDLVTAVMFPLSPILLLIGETVTLDEANGILLPILNCSVNEVIITDDAPPPSFVSIGGHSRESGPALVTDVDSIT